MGQNGKERQTGQENEYAERWWWQHHSPHDQVAVTLVAKIPYLRRLSAHLMHLTLPSQICAQAQETLWHDLQAHAHALPSLSQQSEAALLQQPPTVNLSFTPVECDYLLRHGLVVSILPASEERDHKRHR